MIPANTINTTRPIQFNLKELNVSLAPLPGEAQHDMVMRLRPRTAEASQEWVTGKFGRFIRG